MKIKLLFQGTYPEGMASTNRVHQYAKILIENGFDVEVVVPKAYYKKAGRTFNYKASNKGVPFKLLYNKGQFKYKVFQYLWKEVESYCLLLDILKNIRKFDVFFIYGLTTFPKLLLASFVALSSKKIVQEINEYPFSTRNNGEKSIYVNFLRSLEFNFIFPNIDGFILISDNLLHVVDRIAPKAKKIKVPILNDSKIYLQQSIGKKPTQEEYLFHAGFLTEQKDGFLNVTKAFTTAHKRLLKEGVKLKFILTNKQTRQENWVKIENVLKESGVYEQLIITGYLNNQSLFNYLNFASCLVINKPQTFQNMYNFPTKLADYLLSGSPVIAAAENVELNNFLTNDYNAKVVPPNNTQEMADAIVYMVLNKGEAERIGKNGQQTAINHFDYRKHTENIKKFFEDVQR